MNLFTPSKRRRSAIDQTVRPLPPRCFTVEQMLAQWRSDIIRMVRNYNVTTQIQKFRTNDVNSSASQALQKRFLPQTISISEYRFSTQTDLKQLRQTPTDTDKQYIQMTPPCLRELRTTTDPSATASS